jgi:hypothetical protein
MNYVRNMWSDIGSVTRLDVPAQVISQQGDKQEFSHNSSLRFIPLIPFFLLC